MKCCFLAVLVLLSLDVARGALLVGNTRGDFEITLLQEDNETATVLDGMDGLEAPDHVLWDGTYYYISTGTTNATSSIARYTVETGEFELVWATGGPLMRPYGFASDGDVLYVASFMSDQILMYDGESGSYMGVFAQGDATEEGLCNGPNQIAIYNGTLFLTTQGSYVDENGDLQYAFSSQIVQYDLETGEGSVFVPQPDPIGGFVSMLGILIIDDLMYTTDFAGGLRVYSMEGELLGVQPTAYAEGALTGSLTTDGRSLYVTGFVGDEDGVVMKYDILEDGLVGEMEILYEGDPLQRPIGILFVEDLGGGGSTMEPTEDVTTEGPNESGSNDWRKVCFMGHILAIVVAIL